MTTDDAYRTILMDPPWLERGSGKVKRGADRHYPVMAVRQILPAILTSGFWRPDPIGAVLWCWATNNYLKDALWLIDALGFRYITNAAWVKTGRPGLGQWLRGRHELLLMATAGKRPTTARTDRRDLPGVIEAPRGRHSAKPDAAYRLIEARCHGPRVELFARTARPGWDAWGNEISQPQP